MSDRPDSAQTVRPARPSSATSSTTIRPFKTSSNTLKTPGPRPTLPSRLPRPVASFRQRTKRGASASLPLPTPTSGSSTTSMDASHSYHPSDGASAPAGSPISHNGHHMDAISHPPSIFTTRASTPPLDAPLVTLTSASPLPPGRASLSTQQEHHHHLHHGNSSMDDSLNSSLPMPDPAGFDSSTLSIKKKPSRVSDASMSSCPSPPLKVRRPRFSSTTTAPTPTSLSSFAVPKPPPEPVMQRNSAVSVEDLLGTSAVSADLPSDDVDDQNSQFIQHATSFSSAPAAAPSSTSHQSLSVPRVPVEASKRSGSSGSSSPAVFSFGQPMVTTPMAAARTGAGNRAVRLSSASTTTNPPPTPAMSRLSVTSAISNIPSHQPMVDGNPSSLGSGDSDSSGSPEEDNPLSLSRRLEFLDDANDHDSSSLDMGALSMSGNPSVQGVSPAVLAAPPAATHVPPILAAPQPMQQAVMSTQAMSPVVGELVPNAEHYSPPDNSNVMLDPGSELARRRSSSSISSGRIKKRARFSDGSAPILPDTAAAAVAAAAASVAPPAVPMLIPSQQSPAFNSQVPRGSHQHPLWAARAQAISSASPTFASFASAQPKRPLSTTSSMNSSPLLSSSKGNHLPPLLLPSSNAVVDSPTTAAFPRLSSGPPMSASSPSRPSSSSFPPIPRSNSALSSSREMGTVQSFPTPSDSQDGNVALNAKFLFRGTLGQGAFGTVFRVASKFDKKTMYAIKKSRRRFRGVADRERALQEVRAVAKLSADPHPNCLHYEDYWEEAGYLFIQTELCSLGSLKDLLESGEPLPNSDIWQFLADILSGLQHIHNHGLIHLDVKPANLFLTKDGSLKIGDFGLATDSEHWQDGGEGDSSYLAPELLNGPATPAADIFSSGATVFEMATGAVMPTSGDTWQYLRSGKLSAADMPSVEPALVAMVKSMMTPDPRLRPTATELLEHPKIKEIIQSKSQEVKTGKPAAKWSSKLKQLWRKFKPGPKPHTVARSNSVVSSMEGPLSRSVTPSASALDTRGSWDDWRASLNMEEMEDVSTSSNASMEGLPGYNPYATPTLTNVRVLTRLPGGPPNLSSAPPSSLPPTPSRRSSATSQGGFHTMFAAPVPPLDQATPSRRGSSTSSQGSLHSVFFAHPPSEQGVANRRSGFTTPTFASVREGPSAFNFPTPLGGGAGNGSDLSFPVAVKSESPTKPTSTNWSTAPRRKHALRVSKGDENQVENFLVAANGSHYHQQHHHHHHHHGGAITRHAHTQMHHATPHPPSGQMPPVERITKAGARRMKMRPVTGARSGADGARRTVWRK